MQTNPHGASAPTPPPEMIRTPQGRDIAIRRRPGTGPTVMYLHGYASDMMATKAQYFDAACAARGQAALRFDCSGNGLSPGAFEDGTIGRWTEDALAVIDQATDDDLVLVGSSMGGWIGLQCARLRPERVRAFIGIAAAPDFTAKIWNGLSPEEQELSRARGYVEEPSSLGEPLRLSMAMIEDGWNRLLLDNKLELSIPVVLVQGKLDAEVPWQTAHLIRDILTPAEPEIVFVEDGDHRLARPQDMEMIDGIIRRISAQLRGV